MAKQTFKSFDALKTLLPEGYENTQANNKSQTKQVTHTTAVSKKQKKSKKAMAPKPPKAVDPKLKAIFDTLDWLRKTFPKTFFAPKQKVSALKIGIGQDLIEYIKQNDVESISATAVRKALAMYTHNFRYLVATSTEGNSRIDLNGDEVGKVNKEQAEYAQKILFERKQKRQKKNQAIKTDAENSEKPTV